MARFWFDVLTPKQVIFFKQITDELKKRGHEVLATSRSFREVEPLARMYSFDLEFVGKRGGQSLESQLNADIKRMEKLLPIVLKYRPDAAVSVASNVCARIAFGLRVRHIAINDSPHSEVAAKLSLPLSSHLLTPWIIPYREWEKYGIGRESITKYRALDPAAWLKRKGINGSIPSIDKTRKTIVLRLEESFAPYMIDKSKEWTHHVLETVISKAMNNNIIILYRYKEQYRELRKFSNKAIIPDYVVDGRALLENSDLFIGMGGTMTAEACLLGVPTISAYQGNLYTESFLERKGLLKKAKTKAELSSLIDSMLESRYKESVQANARKLLDWMEDPVERIVSALEKIIGK